MKYVWNGKEYRVILSDGQDIGSVVHGEYRRPYRYDLFTNQRGEKFRDYYFATGPNDNTPHHVISDNYDSRCSCCWLGFGHTEAEHAENVK